MTLEELIFEATKQGAVFTVSSKYQVMVSAPIPLPESLMVELCKHKLELIPLFCLEPDYSLTACKCDRTPDGTGPERWGVCALPLICPVCSLCRGCMLALKFGREVR